jgi:hypothetical protein
MKRQCDNCGVQNLKLLNEEIDVSESELNLVNEKKEERHRYRCLTVVF